MNIFASALGTSKDTGKWMPPFNSAHQIGLSTFLEEVLIVVGSPSSLNLKNSENRHDFHHISTSRDDIAKRSTPFDSAHRIGLYTLLKEVLTVDEGVCGW